MANDSQFQLVTFMLGDELYGVNIMDVKEIVKLQDIRVIPNAPYYVEGIITLRSEIIPIMDLHKRFRIAKPEIKPEDIDEGGIIILNIEKTKVGIIIDKVVRVVSYSGEEVREPPQMVSSIGTEYIYGVIRQESGYLIILDTKKLFSGSELQRILELERG